MKLVVAGESLQPYSSFADLARAAAEAGFAAVELPVTSQAALTPETDHDQCLDILRTFHDAGVSIDALRCDLGAGCHLAAHSHSARDEAERLIAESIRRAGWLKAEVLSVGLADPAPGDPMCDAPDAAAIIADLRRRLMRLIPEAEAWELRVALEVPAETLLPDPVSAAELIDHVNAPCIGLRIEVRRSSKPHVCADWVRQLGWRLAAVHLGDACEDVRQGEYGWLIPLSDKAVFGGPTIVSGGLAADWKARMEPPPSLARPANEDGPAAHPTAP